METFRPPFPSFPSFPNKKINKRGGRKAQQNAGIPGRRPKASPFAPPPVVGSNSFHFFHLVVSHLSMADRGPETGGEPTPAGDMRSPPISYSHYCVASGTKPPRRTLSSNRKRASRAPPLFMASPPVHRVARRPTILPWCRPHCYCPHYCSCCRERVGDQPQVASASVSWSWPSLIIPGLRLPPPAPALVVSTQLSRRSFESFCCCKSDSSPVHSFFLVDFFANTLVCQSCYSLSLCSISLLGLGHRHHPRAKFISANCSRPGHLLSACTCD